ncbi:MAG: glutathione S-transferase family protein [Gaiellaceae bacterium]
MGTNMIKLYYLPGAASLAPHGCLEEAGADYQLVRVVREDGVPKEPANYTDLQPKGRVPALVDGDVATYESAACCMYLAERFPEANLAPASGTPERAAWYRWHTHLTNTVQTEFMSYFAPARSVESDAAQDELKECANRRLSETRDWLDGQLAEAGEYLVGNRFSSADLFLAMLTRWGRRFDEQWWDSSNLGAHYARVTSRPAIKRVYEQQGLED